MPYYIEPAEQTPEVQEQLKAITPASLNPEEITLLDPACGSGHILVEAYDLFKAIYQERGYRARDIPALILQKNLFGLEIDDRAAQLAAFALLMKARADDRRIFASGVQPNVVALQESKGLDARDITAALNAPILKEELPPSEYLLPEVEEAENPLFNRKTLAVEGQVAQADVATLLELFDDAKTFGSLIQIPPKLAENLPSIEQRLRDVLRHGDLSHATAGVIAPLLQQAGLLARQYDAVVANPPYLGMRAMNSAIRAFAQERFPAYKLDTYAVFVARCLALTKPRGTAALVTMHSWMFLHRFTEMRQELLGKRTLLTLAHLGARAFSSLSGEVVQTCAFAVSPSSNPKYVPSFIRCVDGEEDEKMKALAEKRNSFRKFSQDSFLAIEGGILAYWISDQVMHLFHTFPRAEVFASPRHGMVTSDNDRFLRLWWEVQNDRIGLGMQTRQAAAQSGKKWFPYKREARSASGMATWSWSSTGKMTARKLLDTQENFTGRQVAKFKPRNSISGAV
jgi:SAM-dependent methyltransferase